MALKTYASQAEVPEALRGDYVEKDGKWIPDVADAEDLYAAGLKRNQERLLGEVKEAKRKLAEYDGLDPVKAKELKAAAEEAEAKAAKAAGNWEAREAQLKDAFGKEKGALESKLTTMSRSLERVLVENQLRQHLEKVSDYVDIALPHLAKQVKVVEDNGEFVAVVVDGKGNARIKDAQGNAFGIADLVAEMCADKNFAPLVRGSGASGSGAKGSQDGRGGDVKVIPAGDPKAFLDNVDAIAKGKVLVASG